MLASRGVFDLQWCWGKGVCNKVPSTWVARPNDDFGDGHSLADECLASGYASS